MKCIIVDDERIARQGLADYARQLPVLELVGSFADAREAQAFLQDNEAALLFLDIQMPKLNGLDFIRSLAKPPLFIFTTAYREFALDGFELAAVDYLLKPIAFERFQQAVHKAATRYEAQQKEEEEHFFIKSDGKIIRIRYEELLYVEGLKDFAAFHLADGKKHLALISMKKLEATLPTQKFLRTHRSYIIATESATEIDGNRIKVGDNWLPIAKRERRRVLEQLVGNRLIIR